MKTFQNVQCVRCNAIEHFQQTHKKLNKTRKWEKRLDDHPCFNCSFPVWESWLIWEKFYDGTPVYLEMEIERVMNEQVESWIEEQL